MKSNINHIFFDLDNTLWDFDTNSRQVLKDLFFEFNLESRCGVNIENFTREYEKINAKLWAQLRAGEISKEQLRSSRFYNSMQSFGFDDYELGYKMELEYVKRSPYQKNLLPGTLQVLENLKKHYQLHIITNGFKEVQYIKLENCGLKFFFNHIIISEEVGYSKPHEAIFQTAMMKAGAHPEESVMIGDDKETDVKGALNAGMRAIHINIHQKETNAANYLQVNNLFELEKILLQKANP